MADLSWQATPPLARIIEAGRHGANNGTAGVKLTELCDFELLQIMARRGQWPVLAAAAAVKFGASLPSQAWPSMTSAGPFRFTPRKNVASAAAVRATHSITANEQRTARIMAAESVKG